MTLQEALNLIPEGTYKPTVEEVQTFQEFNLENLDIYGNNEIGYFEQVNENLHVRMNDRVDTIIHTIQNSEISAIEINHYHRRGNMFSVKIYK
jgi:hypothetical protein